MRIPVPGVLAALLFCIARPAAGQLPLDPVSRSSAGIWVRPVGDHWCVLGAPPLLSAARAPSAGFAHYPSAWGLPALTASAAAATFPAGPGWLGVSASRFGAGPYTETEFGAGYGLARATLRIGASLRIRRLAIERYGSALTPRLDAAAVLHTGEWLLLGFRMTDLNRGSIGGTGERLREGLTLAAAVTPRGIPSLLLQLGGEGEGGAPTVAAAIAGEAPPLSFTAGASGSFTTIHSGLRLSAGALGLGYGVTVHPVLGWSHAFWFDIGGGS